MCKSWAVAERTMKMLNIPMVVIVTVKKELHSTTNLGSIVPPNKAVPMVWRKLKTHFVDCYFYLVNIKGILRNNRYMQTYPNLALAIRTISYQLDLSKGQGQLSQQDIKTMEEMYQGRRDTFWANMCDDFCKYVAVQ